MKSKQSNSWRLMITRQATFELTLYDQLAMADQGIVKKPLAPAADIEGRSAGTTVEHADAL